MRLAIDFDLDNPNYFIDNPYPHSIWYTMSYTVFGPSIRNRISLSVEYDKIGHGYLNTDPELNLVQKLSYPLTPLTKSNNKEIAHLCTD
jgi:hypothetical protein